MCARRLALALLGVGLQPAVGVGVEPEIFQRAAHRRVKLLGAEVVADLESLPQAAATIEREMMPARTNRRLTEFT